MSREELLQACLTLSKHLGLVAAGLGRRLCCRGGSVVAVQWDLGEEDPTGGSWEEGSGTAQHSQTSAPPMVSHCPSQGTERERDSRAHT